MASANGPKAYKSPFRLAAEALRTMPMEDRIQLLVEAGLMEQEEADRAKLRYRQRHGGGDTERRPTAPESVAITDEVTAPGDRTELLKVLAELGRRYPTWRFGQLVSNVAGWADVDAWDVEDERLLAAARRHLEQAAEREAKVGR